MSCSGLVLVSTLCCTQWLWDALQLHCYGKQDWLHQNNVISLDKYLNCWLNDPVHRKQTMCLVWLFLFCIKRTLEVATLMFDIRPYQSWSAMEKVFSIKLNAYLAQRCKRYLIFFFYIFTFYRSSSTRTKTSRAVSMSAKMTPATFKVTSIAAILSKWREDSG